jgi:hypothetical protein
MVGGTAALPQAKGLDGGEPDEEGQQEVYVGHRKTKRRKGGHGDKVCSPVLPDVTATAARCATGSTPLWVVGTAGSM